MAPGDLPPARHRRAPQPSRLADPGSGAARGARRRPGRPPPAPRRTPGAGGRLRGPARHLSRRPRPPRSRSPALRRGCLRVIPALVVVAFAGLALWILGPLRAPSRRTGEEGDARWKELVDAKHAIYRSILDLEFDRAVGKVSEEDYAVLRRQQEAEALAVLTEMDALASTAEASPDTLEAETAPARERLRPLQ